MSPALTVRLALKNIIGNRLRSGLTILGLVIGIASVILLVGMVNGAGQTINDEIATMGADVISVSIWDETELQNEDIKGMEQIDLITKASPYVFIDATLSKGGEKSIGSSIYGAGDGFTEIMGYEIASGRPLSRIDINNCTKVVVIGSGIAAKFWNNADPCGRTLKLNGDEYTVVGVMKSMGNAMGNNVDETVIMPITSAKFLGESTAISELYLKADSEEVVDDAVKNVQSYLSGTLGVDPEFCEVSTQKMMLEAMEDINRTMALLLGGIASISLLVGGIGVMNVMLVSVTERTREIGIRKSLGARKKDIMYQFLTESMVLSLLGGIIGILTGLLLGRLVILFGQAFAPGLGMILLSVGVSVAVGLLFGILPSYRAACLKPVEALRYE